MNHQSPRRVKCWLRLRGGRHPDLIRRQRVWSSERYPLRPENPLRQSPAFAAIAIGSLAIGIGANTALFSVIRSLLLEPLPVEKPEELALVYWSSPSQSKALSYTELAGGCQEDRATGVTYQSNYSYPAY